MIQLTFQIAETVPMPMYFKCAGDLYDRAARCTMVLAGRRVHQVIESHSNPVKLSATASDAPPRTAKIASTLTAVPGEIIDSGEIVILAVKPSMWRPLFDSTPWIVTCGLLAVVVVWLGRTIPGLSLATTAQVILLAAVARLGFAIIRWVPTWYVLTNRRVLHVRGVRTPRFGACALTEIRNTYLHVSTGERATGLGTITFVTDRQDEVSQIWRSVPNAADVHDKIRRAIENALDQHSHGL